MASGVWEGIFNGVLKLVLCYYLSILYIDAYVCYLLDKNAWGSI